MTSIRPDSVDGLGPLKREAELSRLRDELAHTETPSARAEVLYEIATFLELRTQNEAAAVREYLSSYNADPAFRPPLLSLIRLFERRRVTQNLRKLYEALAKSARTPRERASALVDLACFSLSTEPEAAVTLLRRALKLDPGCASAAILLGAQNHAGELSESAVEDGVAHANAATDPRLRSALLVEAGIDAEHVGLTDRSLEILRQALLEPEGRWYAALVLEWVARKHGRIAELVAAIETRALMLAQVARGSASETRELFGTELDVKRRDEISRESAALWCEAAYSRAFELTDPEGGVLALGQSVALRPADLVYREERMFAAELAGDTETAAVDAKVLLDSGEYIGPLAASLHFRLAERAVARDETANARAALEEAMKLSRSTRGADHAGTDDGSKHGSAAVFGLLDDLRVDLGEHDARALAWADVARATDEKMIRSELLIKAGNIARVFGAQGDQSSRSAFALLHEAYEAHPSGTAARELYGAARVTGDAALVRRALDAILSEEDVGESERSAALLEQIARVWASRPTDGSPAAGLDALLRRSLSEPTHEVWAPRVARALAAASDDWDALATAHERLAVHAQDSEIAAAHAVAGARALVRNRDIAAAEKLLRQALELSPGHDYALAMLEEVLRARGDAQGVVSLVRDAELGARGQEYTLLRAGSLAEAAGNSEIAITTYLEALERQPGSISSALMLERCAARLGNHSLRLLALDQLGRASTLKDEDAARVALDRLTLRLLGVVPHANVDTASDRPPEPPLDVEGELAVLFQRDETRLRAAALGFVASASNAPAERDAYARVLLDAAKDNLALTDYEVSRLVFGRGPFEGDEVDSVAEAPALRMSPDPMRFMTDPSYRIEKLESKRESDESLLGDRESIDAQSARARALLETGRFAEAHQLARALLANESTQRDGALWETLRCAAREQRDWADVVRACTRLAPLVTGELRADLLEEAGIVSADSLADEVGAIEAFRGALAADPARRVSFGRLHDALVQQNDLRGVIDLLELRSMHVDDPAELADLLYAKARLLRVSGNTDAALVCLDELLLLDGDHVGALALKVEISTRARRFDEAVSALRAIANAKVPVSQQRLVRLAAADMLANKLERIEDAIVELDAIPEHARDAVVHIKRAQLADQIGDAAGAATSYEQAWELSERSNSEHAVLAARAAQRSGDLVAARRLLRGAWETDPTRTEVVLELYAASDVRDRQRVAEQLVKNAEAMLAESFSNSGSDDESPVAKGISLTAIALEQRALAAEWNGDRGVTRRCREIVYWLGGDDTEAAARARGEADAKRLKGTLTSDDDAVLAPFSGTMRTLFSAVSNAVADIDGNKPARWDVIGGPVQMSGRTKDWIDGISRAMGFSVRSVYGTETHKHARVALPQSERSIDWILGTDCLRALDDGDVFTLARAAFAARLQIPMFALHDPRRWVQRVRECAAAVDLPLAEEDTDFGPLPSPEELKRSRKAISRGARAALDEALKRKRVTVTDVAAAATIADASLDRAGLVILGGIGYAMDALGVSTDGLLARRDARRLVRFWSEKDVDAVLANLGGGA